MKKIIALIVFGCVSAFAQVKTPQPSPKASLVQTVGLTEVAVDYSRPTMKGRKVFGELVSFGKLWRTGANYNTTISFSDDVVIDGKTLKAGKYALFTIPKIDTWEFIFYKDNDNWGTPAELDEAKVALRSTVKPEITAKSIESFTIAVNPIDVNSATLDLSWERSLASLKFDVPTYKTAMASIEKTLAGPSGNDYYSAGVFLFTSNGDIVKALEYVNKGIGMSKDASFWMLRQKSLIQAKMGDKKGAIETAKLSLAAATDAKNADYVKMNNDSIAEWSKK
ncbi:MAG: hypothetical protein RIT03_262 [Bacteroidota bacterium]|jgi:hypothetical protein